jgi:DNA repair exonuclease SbcCD nuclease subunit
MSVTSRSSIRLLHTADLHLGAPFVWLGELAATRQKDLLLTFRRIVDCCLERRVDLLLIAGDLFDHARPEPSLCLAVQAELARLQKHDITAVLLPGTHDGVWGGETYSTAQFPAAVILDQVRDHGPLKLQLKGQSLYLYGSAYRGEKPEEYYPRMRRQEGDGYHVGLLHGALKKSPQWEYRDKDLPFTLDELNSWGLDYVALGHYHTYQELHQRGAVIACYPGSPEGKQFSETGERFVALLELTPAGTRIAPLPIQSRTLASLQIDMNNEPSLETLHKRIAALADEKLLLRLELTGLLDVPFDREATLRLFRDAFFHLELIDKTRFLDGALVRQLACEETIAGACIRRFQELLQDQPDNRELIESAMKEVILRFSSRPGVRS